MRTLLPLFLFVLLLGLPACENESGAGDSSPPASPEQVFREWQDHLDRNEFAQVRAMSTPETESLISLVEDLANMLPEDSTLVHTEFSGLSCKNLTDSTAICYYEIREEEGNYPDSSEAFYRDSIDLVLRNGRWLVHSPLRFNEDELDLEGLFEEDILQGGEIYEQE